MKQELIVTRRAERQIESAYDWYRLRDSTSAERWFSALLQTLDEVCRALDRFPLAEESRKFPIQLRQATFGAGKSKTHRCLFSQRPEGIVIYAVRHLAQDELDPESWGLSDEGSDV